MAAKPLGHQLRGTACNIAEDRHCAERDQHLKMRSDDARRLRAKLGHVELEITWSAASPRGISSWGRQGTAAT